MAAVRSRHRGGKVTFLRHDRMKRPGTIRIDGLVRPIGAFKRLGMAVCAGVLASFIRLGFRDGLDA